MTRVEQQNNAGKGAPLLLSGGTPGHGSSYNNNFLWFKIMLVLLNCHPLLLPLGQHVYIRVPDTTTLRAPGRRTHGITLTTSTHNTLNINTCWWEEPTHSLLPYHGSTSLGCLFDPRGGAEGGRLSFHPHDGCSATVEQDANASTSTSVAMPPPCTGRITDERKVHVSTYCLS